MTDLPQELIPHPLVIWTRSVDHWQEDLGLWRDLTSFVPWAIPCIKTQALAVPDFPWHQQGPLLKLGERSRSELILIITSPRAVEIMNQDENLRTILLEASVRITHGPATAQAIRNLGLTVDLRNELRSSSQLATWIAETTPQTKPLLFVSPKEPAFDFQGFLKERGFQIQRLVCYETISRVEPAFLGRLRLVTLQKPAHGVVCFASPSAVKGFVSECQERQWPLPDFKGVSVIGPTTAEEASRWFMDVTTAATNSLSDLIKTAIDLLPDGE